MRTKSDLTISFIFIGYGVFFFVLTIMADNSVGIELFLLCMSVLWFLMGFGKMETYEITGNILLKRSFLGLVNKRRDLNHLSNYSVKSINMDISVNPVNIVKLFSKNSKCLIFREATLNFGDYRRMKIDERTIVSQDFNKLINKIKPYIKKDKSAATFRK